MEVMWDNDRWQGDLIAGSSMLIHTGWRSGWLQDQDNGYTLNGRALPKVMATDLFFGTVKHACDLLPEGEIQIFGLGPLQLDLGRQVVQDSKRVLDLSAELLTTPSLFDTLAPESECVVLVHPLFPPCSFDFYSTIHRHSHRVRFVSWEVDTAPLSCPPLNLPRVKTGDKVLQGSTWVWLEP